MQQHAYAKLSGKRLVIFGCGYVGGEVAHRARTIGMKVTALTRNPAKAEALRGQGVEVVQAELASGEWYGAITGPVDFVLNSVSSGGRGVQGYRRSYVEGMHSLLAWTRRNQVGTIVYTSSTSVYAQGGGVRVTEKDLAEGRSETGAVLVEAEDVLRAAMTARSEVKASERSCDRWFILRLAGIYGPGRHTLLDQLREGATEVPNDRSHRLNLIYRDDIARAVLDCFAADESVRDHILNLADDAATPKAEIVRWLIERLGIDPARLTAAAASSRRGPVPDRIVDNAKAKQVLGWRPQFPDFRAGYEKILSL